jgi:hypothetical protein
MNRIISAMFAYFMVCAVAIADPIDTAAGCKSNTAVVAACFSIRGRVFASNGTPSMRIWSVGTKRLFGVVPVENENLPSNLQDKVTFEQSVYANLELCPITQSHPGTMQSVCVESATNIVVHRNE